MTAKSQWARDCDGNYSFGDYRITWYWRYSNVQSGPKNYVVKVIDSGKVKRIAEVHSFREAIAKAESHIGGGAAMKPTKVGIFETNVCGVKAWHARCLECGWQTKRKTNEAEAVRLASNHVCKKCLAK